MSERTLLAPAFWGRSDYRGFFLWSLTETARAVSAGFVWGGTSALKAFQRYGFDSYDCFVHDALAFRPAAVMRAATAPFSWKSRAFYAALYALSLLQALAVAARLRRTPWTVAEEVPADAELAMLMQTISQRPSRQLLHSLHAGEARLVRDKQSLSQAGGRDLPPRWRASTASPSSRIARTASPR